MATLLMLMLMLVLATATVHAADEVRDPRLRVQNLTRPDGKQSATLTGWTSPGASSRRVTVTLRVGDATVAFAGKVSRSGRLRAAGRRLVLATALAAFTRIDVEVTGAIATSLTLASGDCVRARSGRSIECALATTALVDGVYDLVVADRTAPGRSDVASLFRTTGDARSLALYMSEFDSASLAVAPDLGLSGHFILGGDIGISVEGSAVDRSTSQVARLDGSVSSMPGFPFPVAADFSLRRPVGGTPSANGGTWNVALHGGGRESLDGTMVLALEVPASSKATAAPTTIEQANGPRYTISGGACDVTPAGGIHCLLAITDPPDRYSMILHGFLDVAAGTGEGRFVTGAAPQIYSNGTWSASR